MPGPFRAAIATGPWWRILLLFVLGTAWGLQFTLLKIAEGSSLSELGILTLCMLLLAAAYLGAPLRPKGVVPAEPGTGALLLGQRLLRLRRALRAR